MGNYLVELSGGNERRFSDLHRARGWARGFLEIMSPGSWAEIYRDDRGTARFVEALRKDARGVVGPDRRGSVKRRGRLGLRARSTGSWIRVPLDRARPGMSRTTSSAKRDLSQTDLMRLVIDEELSDFADEFTVEPLRTSVPRYLGAITFDAGVEPADFRAALRELQKLEKKGRGGSHDADEAAREIRRFVREFREQVKNASAGQVAQYVKSRSRWINR